jgi:PAS domain S-box-containing protein
VKWPSNRRLVSVAFWVAVAILVGIAFATHQSTVRLVATSGRVEHARELTDNLQQVLFGLQEAEVDARALIRSGKSFHQIQRATATGQVATALSNLNRLTADDAGQRQDVDALAVLIANHQALLDGALKISAQQGADAALAYLDTERSRSLTDQIRASVERMQDTERRLVQRRDDELRARAETNIAVFVVGSFVSLAILLAVFLYLNLQIVARRMAERALAEEKELLEQQYRREAALAEIELVVNEPHELQIVLERVARVVTEVLPAAGASVILYDEKAQEFVVSASTVPGQNPASGKDRVRKTGGATRWIIENRQPLVVSDVRNDPHGANPMLTEYGLQSYVGMPLVVEGEVLGVIYALDRLPREFRHDELDFLRALAARAALAISKVQLYAKLQDVNRLLEERVAQRTLALSLANEQLVHEIKEHQSDEQAMRESEKKYRDLIEGAYDMIQTLTPDGRLLSVNHAWLHTLGYTEAEVPQLTIFDIIHPDNIALCQNVLARLRKGESVTNLAVTFVTKDGRAIPVEGNATALLRNGEVVASHGFFRDVSERKRAEQALHELSGRLLQLQDQERRRIARELHDVTAQNLSAITLNLARLEKLIPAKDEKTRKVVSESLALGEESLRDIRTLSYLLHPPMLDESGLFVALEWYLNGFAKRSGVRVNLSALSDIDRLPAEMETALFRVVQESLTNIHRHSGSKVATVEVFQDDFQVILEVRDEGRGMAELPEGGVLGVGIRGMRERLRQLGGRLEITSNERGTKVRAVLPLVRSTL